MNIMYLIYLKNLKLLAEEFLKKEINDVKNVEIQKY